MVSRLFQMVYLLMDKPYITAKELSETLEVSMRTVYRDVDKLSSAGIPIYANRGKGGGISLLSDYVLDKMVLTKDEKAKIAESLQALSSVDDADEKQALARLQSFFGTELSDWIEIEFTSWGDSSEKAERFRQLKQAILHHNYVEIVYSGSNQKTVNASSNHLNYVFVNKHGIYMLIAKCEKIIVSLSYEEFQHCT